MPTPIVTPHHKPAKQARGRRIVLLLVGFIVAGQGLAGYVIDHHGLAIRFPTAATALSDAEDGPPPQIIWMGSSRSEALRPDVMNTGLWKRYGRHRVNLFNAAVPAGDPVTSEFLLDAFLERGHRPEILVVEVCPYLLMRNSIMVGMHVIRQTNWSDVPAFLPEAVSTNNLARLASARLMPLYLHRRSIRGLLLPPKTGEPPALFSHRSWASGHPRLEYLQDYPEVPTPPELAQGRVEFDTKKIGQLFQNYQPDGVASAALGRLLSRCKAEGISVVLVFPAVAEAMRDQYTPTIERRFLDELTRMRQIHPFEIVDLRDTVPDAGFNDLLHLSSSGGLIYSRIALERVVLPAVERRGIGVSR